MKELDYDFKISQWIDGPAPRSPILSDDIPRQRDHYAALFGISTRYLSREEFDHIIPLATCVGNIYDFHKGLGRLQIRHFKFIDEKYKALFLLKWQG